MHWKHQHQSVSNYVILHDIASINVAIYKTHANVGIMNVEYPYTPTSHLNQ